MALALMMERGRRGSPAMDAGSAWTVRSSPRRMHPKDTASGTTAATKAVSKRSVLFAGGEVYRERYPHEPMRSAGRNTMEAEKPLSDAVTNSAVAPTACMQRGAIARGSTEGATRASGDAGSKEPDAKMPPDTMAHEVRKLLHARRPGSRSGSVAEGQDDHWHHITVY